MKERKKLAYLPMAVDMIHPGHLNIINAAASLDATVMVGCYSDEAIASYKRLPFMNYQQRKTVIESIKNVDIVVEQKTRDLEENIRKYKPDYVVHGTDWRDGALSMARERTIKILKEWGGQLIEPQYTEGISSTIAHVHLKQVGTTPYERNTRLRKLLNVKKSLMAMQVHNALSALTVENAIIQSSGKPTLEFDAFWLNECTLSLSKGRDDKTLIDISSKRDILNDIFDVTTKPLIFDGRSIIENKQFVYTIKILEHIGASAIVIEDNDIGNFCEKLRVGKKNQLISDFMIIAKIRNTLFNDASINDIMMVIDSYIDASADAIMIEYNDSNLNVITSVIEKIKNNKTFIFILTDTYNIEIKRQLQAIPHCIVYNSHMLGAAYNAMKNEATEVLNTCNSTNSITKKSQSSAMIEAILPNTYIE